MGHLTDVCEGVTCLFLLCVFCCCFWGGSSDLIYRNKLFAFMWLPQSVATMKYESLPTIYCVRDNLLGGHARQLSRQVSGGTLSLSRSPSQCTQEPVVNGRRMCSQTQPKVLEKAMVVTYSPVASNLLLVKERKRNTDRLLICQSTVMDTDQKACTTLTCKLENKKRAETHSFDSLLAFPFNIIGMAWL